MRFSSWSFWLNPSGKDVARKEIVLGIDHIHLLHLDCPETAIYFINALRGNLYLEPLDVSLIPDRHRILPALAAA
jgi:hypothetical protein